MNPYYVLIYVFYSVEIIDNNYSTVNLVLGFGSNIPLSNETNIDYGIIKIGLLT